MTLVPRMMGGLALASLALLGGCETVANARLFLPPTSQDMVQIGGDVVVEAAADAQQRAQALSARAQAHAKLLSALGAVQSAPVHYFCHTNVCYADFGGGLPRAKSFGPHRTLMSPYGADAATVAHEWWHAELYARLGFWHWRQVPRWFDEGAAVWVSDDPRYGEPVYQAVLAQGTVPPKLQELEARRDFIAAVGRYGDHLKTRTPDAITVVYPTAAHEVRRWMEVAGVDGLRELLAGLGRGEPFAALYTAIEARSTAGRPRP